jgi:hypothetical protein
MPKNREEILMTIYDRKCNATRYLAQKEFARLEKIKVIRAYLWAFTLTGLSTCLIVEIARAL